MNKLKIKALLSILVLSLALTGCAGKDDKPAAPNANQGNVQMPPSGEGQGHASVTPDASFKTDELVANITKSIDSMYPGDWKVEGTTLKKGEYTENNNFGIVDAVEAQYPGAMVSIFVGETRVSTSVKNSSTGQRTLDYPIPEQIAEVMTSGKAIAGGAGSMGASSYNKVYMPIKAGDKTIAVLSASIPK